MLDVHNHPFFRPRSEAEAELGSRISVPLARTIAGNDTKFGALRQELATRVYDYYLNKSEGDRQLAEDSLLTHRLVSINGTELTVRAFISGYPVEAEEDIALLLDELVDSTVSIDEADFFAA